MALVACRECGKQVSTLAKSCPACGAPVAATGREPIVSAGLLGRLAAVLGAWLVVPWLVRLIAFVAGVVMLIVMFNAAR